MSQDDERAKREEDRIARTMNNVGRRGARPQSWNVPSSGSSFSGGAIGQRDTGLKAIQDQIREEERKQQQQSTHLQPHQPTHQPLHTPHQPSYQYQPQHLPPRSPTPTGGTGRATSTIRVPSGSNAPPPTNIPRLDQSNGNNEVVSPRMNAAEDKEVKATKEFLEVDKEKKARQEEDRLERWLRKGGKYDTAADDRPARAPSREGTLSPEPVAIAPRHTPSPSFSSPSTSTNPSPSPNAANFGPKFQDQIIQASKALKLKRPEDLARWSFAAVATAKSIGEALLDDPDILGYAKALEASANALRSNLDSGADGSQFYYELSGALGQLYVAVVGTI